MKVRRVETEAGGSHIEPPLDQSWSNLDKLRWHAAVLKVDTGVSVDVVEQSRGKFAFVSRSTGTSGMSFTDAWRYVNGMDHGAREANAS